MRTPRAFPFLPPFFGPLESIAFEAARGISGVRFL